MNIFKRFIYWLLPDAKRRPETNHIGFGVEKSLFDERDYVVSTTTNKTLPSKFSLREYCGVVENQGMYESCVAHALCDCIEALARVHNQKEVFELSRMHLWAIGRERTYGQHWQVNKGVYIRSAWEGLRKEAITIEKLFPYSADNAFSKPRKSFVFAWYPTDFRYFFIKDKDVALKEKKIKEALFVNKSLVSFGIRLPKRITNLRIHAEAFKPGENEQLVYAHAMTVVGWDDEKSAFLIKNSWGTKFGNSGFFWIDKEYFLNKAFDITYANR